MKKRNPTCFGNFNFDFFPFILMWTMLLLPISAKDSDSATWSQRYEAKSATPDRETRAGWKVTENAATATVVGDHLNITTPNERAYYYVAQKDARDAWGKLIRDDNSWAIEIRARVLDNGGPDGGLNIWAGNGTKDTAYCTIRKDSVTWGLAKTGQKVLARKMDNSSEFHTYRVSYSAGSDTFNVTRDGRTIGSKLSSGIGYPNRWLLIGDTGATGWVRGQIDYIRWAAAKPAPKSATTTKPATTTASTAPIQSAGGDRASRGNGLRIVGFGDSVTQAYGIKKSYLDYLGDALKRKKIEHNIINAGVPAATTLRSAADTPFAGRHALDRLNNIRASRPDLVIVQFGINDSWVDNGQADGPPRVSLRDFQENLIQIVRTLRGDGTRVILMTPNPLGDRKIENWRDKRVEPYSRGVKAVGKITGVPVVDTRAKLRNFKKDLDFLLADSMHPNHFGHELMAEALIPFALRQLGHGTTRRFDASDKLKPIIAASLGKKSDGQVLAADTLKRTDQSILAAVLTDIKGTKATQLLLSRDLGKSWNQVKAPASLKQITGTTSLIPLGTPGELLLLSLGGNTLQASFGSNGGASWTAPAPVFPAGSIRPLAPPRQLAGRADGKLLMLFHGERPSGSSKGGTLTECFQCVSSDGGRTWDAPKQVSFHLDQPNAKPSFPALIRTQTGTLAALAGDASGTYGPLLMESPNDGLNWNRMTEAHDSIAGTDHRLLTAPDGKGLALFKDKRGDLQLWVGSMTELAQGWPAQGIIRLFDNPGSAKDVNTAGLENVGENKYVATFVARPSRRASPALMCLRFNLDELLAK